jgi:heme-degrading monooxygenase HmoA
MFVLHVELKVKPGLQQALEQTYREVFVPAISPQPGFRSADLLRPVEAGVDYRLALAFDDQALQQAWVATDLHQQVWPQMESRCAGFSAIGYNTV